MLTSARYWLFLLFISFISSRSNHTFGRPILQKNIAFVYGEPVDSENFLAVLSRITAHQYSQTADTDLFPPGTSVWIHIPGSLIAKDVTRSLLVTGYQDYVDLYVKREGKWQKIRAGGKFAHHDNISDKVGRYFIQLNAANEAIPSEGYLVACRKYNNYNFSPLMASLMTSTERATWHSNFQLSANSYAIIFPLFGVLSTTILVLLIQFFLSRDWSYSTHALGLLLLLSFCVLFYFEYPININSCPVKNPRILIDFNSTVLFFAVSCNFLSVRAFYENSGYVERDNRIPNQLAILSGIIGIGIFIVSFYTHQYYIINTVCIYLSTALSILFGIHLFKMKSEIKGSFKIFVMGLCVLSFFTQLAFSLVLFAEKNPWGYGTELLLLVPMITGVALFNGFTITAMVTRNFVGQLENANLRSKAREAELIVVQKGLNPHFIFNCLNLIDSFLYSNNNKAARKVLFEFSDLLRMVIDKSPNQLILLSEELKMLELYLNLEKSRSDNCFSYRIAIDKNIVTKAYLVPPLLIQPIAENSIKHGILNKQIKGGNIIISIFILSETTLEINVDDDGVGLLTAEKLRRNSSFQVGHFGLSLTRKRLEILTQVYKIESDLKILDKMNGDAGTIVKMKVPLIRADSNH